MSSSFIYLLIISFLISNIVCQYKNKTNNNSNPSIFNFLFNSTTKNMTSLKYHNKILQTVYSDSFSKNYYYTTLYVGHNKVKQTYIIDTASSIISSPCSPCQNCGQHKKAFYYDINRKHRPLECKSKICQLTPATGCMNKESKFLSSGNCSFRIKRAGGDGIKGYFMKDIVYFETKKKIKNPFLHRKSYRSYALPIGCTTGEYGKYKELKTDGIIGMSNNPKSFISLLHNLKIVRNIFTLCFGLRGGYMSLGEIDKTFHLSEEIEYVRLLNSDIYYLIKLNSLKVGNNSVRNIIKTPIIARIDTGNTISYFPRIIHKKITKQFKSFCNNQMGKCGNFTYDHELGYCASFSDRESLFKAIYQHWPNITLRFGKSEYKWKPINYYYYYFNSTVRKACLGLNYHSSQYVILGSNFIHGYDIIFDRARKRLGFVPADCSRGNLIWNKWKGIIGNKTSINQNQTKDIFLLDKELHHNERKKKFHLGDNNKDYMIEFIQGRNNELDKKEINEINYFILIISFLIISVVILILVFSILICGKKRKSKKKR